MWWEMNINFLGRSLREWLSSLPVIIILLGVLFLSIGENLNAQLNKLGNHIWPDYHILRLDVPVPTCDPNVDIESEVQKVVRQKQKEAESDPFGGMFGAEDINRDAIRESLGKRVELCRMKHEAAQKTLAQKTDNLDRFVAVDMTLSALSQFRRDNTQVFLAIVFFVCAITAALTHHHIGLRPMQTVLEYRFGITAQLFANLSLTYSAYSYLTNGWASGTLIQNEHIRWFYLFGFGALSLVALVQLFNIPKTAKPGGSIGKALLAVPLYAYMAISSARFFILETENPQGMVLFVDKIMDQSSLFLNIGLYIWVGMLLKQTYLGEYVFRVFKPWKLPPELLAFVAVVIMAVPTAYTGASGIIIIAMGAVVYAELRRVGARRNLALAATAMSGSLGVVLRPCLLVLLIAMLNKEVTTDMMYGWGVKVFLLTSFLFFAVSLIAKQGPMKIAPVSEALAPSLQAFRPLIPYVLIFVVTAAAYAFLLDAHLDEHTAPVVLPMIILLLLVYEYTIKHAEREQHETYEGEVRASSLEGSIRRATTDTTVHIGALLSIMALSLTVGGVIEDSGIFEEVAAQSDFFGSTWTAMLALVVVLVIIGMIMDPFGAIVLVSGTVAQAAYSQGIDPLHFWMITLVAFELGYLSPPVAVNHLLTRQVVGEEEIAKAKEETKGKSFWIRHERYVLPITVMAIALVLVAFGPLVYQQYF
ncbi:MAG: C4-dicarboxylate ABC transporter [Pseudomonadales bacterium]|jgi:TRAP-type C4-dicarboxylate transport system permease large subunit|nr:C4-dicarboxylate ABC transporter [Pseudomonadales bacterium]RLT91535.1 MAG: TRAP transporter large permease subunit [Ketobacter sp. GenoA1]RLT96185.1 MAG: TRAP transporter large permease subunit [Ketobacter sp.]TNC88338.1 MAG: C4-dicarboxylate ABC transporter [Alcanivorax sp.]HAG96757.1 C4-dicarboxylate ABC transporter [Gammaproteobacteria bacterium]|tara:strand:+ start:13587 stop:15692 length:2106 start_codon:yes stop_codon:yes gene_type:complete